MFGILATSHSSTNANPSNVLHECRKLPPFTLTAIGAGGANILARTNFIVVTNVPPTANFSASPTNGISPLTVSFTNLSSGATNYNWNFGDGQISASANPIHVYTNTGSFTVMLKRNRCGRDKYFFARKLYCRNKFYADIVADFGQNDY